MREILFKAKRMDNGEWVEGSYVYRPKEVGDYRDSHYILVHDEYGFNWIEIDIDILCQYTGLHDKNGKKIFEGDIVRYNDNSPCKIEYIDCQFAMMWEKFYRDFEDVYDHDIEVIGNIHDNHELLKGGVQG